MKELIERLNKIEKDCIRRGADWKGDYLPELKVIPKIREILQAFKSAEEELPERKKTKDCEDCDGYHTMIEHGCSCNENGKNKGFNQAIDVAIPILTKAKLRIEELEAIVMRRGSQVLEFQRIAKDLNKKLQSLKNKLTVENITEILSRALCWKNKFVGNSEIGTPKEIINRVAQALIKELTGGGR